MKNKKFKLHTDAGHGWLAVKRKVINELGVNVSEYSYQKGQTVYLEEDADMSAFISKFESVHGVKPTIVEGSYRDRSHIRSYYRYVKESQ